MTVDSRMRETIVTQLGELAAERRLRLLYACESGSRAWGFASPDSDYDVRFIYARDRDWYLSLFPGPDVVELPVNDQLDVNGWDLRKALLLLRRSNGALIEWLHSPISYYVHKAAAGAMQALAKKAFLPETTSYHYLGMARKAAAHVLGQSLLRFKPYLYAFRPLLCCQWIIDELSPPPVLFQTLVTRYLPSGDTREALDRLLALKHESTEASHMPRRQEPELFAMLDGYLRRIPPFPRSPTIQPVGEGVLLAPFLTGPCGECRGVGPQSRYRGGLYLRPDANWGGRRSRRLL